MKRAFYSLLLIVNIALFFVGCPSPLEEQDLTLLQDLNGPQITLFAPGVFESILTVTGTVVDLDEKGDVRIVDAATYIKNASYLITAENGAFGTIDLNDDGSFTFQIENMNSYSSQITLVVSADDKNGNRSQTSLTLIPDAEGPSLVITSPDNYEEYASIIVLQGFVTDGQDVEGQADDTFDQVIPDIEYQIPGTSISGTVTIDYVVNDSGEEVFDGTADGSFYKEINLSSIEGSRTLEITACDINGNETTVVLNLVKPAAGGDISGFFITPGNKQVEIGWDAVEGAQTYRLYELSYAVDSGELPCFVAETALADGWASEGNGLYRYRNGPFYYNDGSYIYFWYGLDNADIFNFQVAAEFSGESGIDTAFSIELSTMTLSPLTLAPWVKSNGSGNITIQWRDLPEVSRYQVERTTTPHVESSWIVVRNLSAAQYIDSDVEVDVPYYYRISPSEYPDRPSEYCEAVCDSFTHRLAAQIMLDNSAANIVIVGDYGYLANSNAGLFIVDLTDPENPGESRLLPLNGYSANDVCVVGNYAYVTHGGDRVTSYGGLYVIDISDPMNPAIKGSYSSQKVCAAVEVAGDYAFVANNSIGLTTVNVSDPEAPVYVDNLVLSGNATDVVLDGNIAYVASTYTLTAVNITDPASLSSIGSEYDLVAATLTGMAIYNGYLYGSCYGSDTGSGFYEFNLADITNGNGPALSDSIDWDGSPRDIYISGGIAYIADTVFGSVTMNLTDGFSGPYILNISGSYWGVFEKNGYLYYADKTANKLDIIKLNDPDFSGNPYRESLNGNGKNIFYNQSALYVSVNSEGVALVDNLNLVSEPDADDSSIDVSYFSGDSCFDTVISGGFAFIADYMNEDFLIVDLSDPENKRTSLNLGMVVNCVTVAGDYAYLGVSSGLAIVDIGDPLAPILVNQQVLKEKTPWEIVVDGSYAFMTNGAAGLAITDISDPENLPAPIYVGVTGSYHNLVKKGDYIILGSTNATGITYLTAINVKNPENPGVPVEMEMNLGGVQDMAAAGDYLYVLNNTNYLSIYNCFTPTNLGYVGSHSPGIGNPMGISVFGSCVYSCDSMGLTIISLLGKDLIP